jgi:rhodanese-related sulfurtransferase
MQMQGLGMGGAESTTPGIKQRARSSLVRDALAIVLSGIALGFAFNHLELTSRPPRGLPWIATPRVLDSVDSPASAAGVPAQEHLPPMPASVPDTPAPPSTVPDAGPPHPPAARSAEEAGTPSSATPAVASAPVPPATADSGTVAASPLMASALRAGLPVIPDVGRLLRVGLPTVVKFVEARAALIVDAREHGAFADGHIPGAVSVAYQEAVGDPGLLETLDPQGRPIIVYCSGGACEESLMLAEIMVRDFKMLRVLVYEGGFGEWTAAGHPVVREFE